MYVENNKSVSFHVSLISNLLVFWFYLMEISSTVRTAQSLHLSIPKVTLTSETVDYRNCALIDLDFAQILWSSTFTVHKNNICYFEGDNVNNFLIYILRRINR